MAIVHDLVVLPQRRPLFGSVPVPGDETIGQLALLCAAMADDASEVRRLALGSDTTTMIDALRRLDVAIEVGPKGTAKVRGVGLRRLAATEPTIDCGGSASTMRLLAAVLVAQPFAAVLGGDEVLCETDMAELAGVLRGRGASIEGVLSQTEIGRVTPPLVVGPLPARRRLSGIEHDLALPAPELKEALLLSGLHAEEATYVRERLVSRDHAERMLQALDVPIKMAGSVVRLGVEDWSAKLPAFAEQVPGDFSATALLLAAGLMVPGSRVCVRETGLNPTRTGALDFFRRMGGAIDVEVHKAVLGEPEGVACASHATLVAAAIAGESLARGGADLAVLTALAARAHGHTEIAGLREICGPRAAAVRLRLTSLLSSFGVGCDLTDDGLVIAGKPERAISAADFDAEDDLLAAEGAMLLALLGDGPSRVRRVDVLARRFPRLIGTLRALGADVRAEERTV